MASVTTYESFLCGGVAGVAVDVALYPLDTIKTRLQAPQGFIKAGGFSGIYRGLSVTALGSAPGAALFFASYENAKTALEPMDAPVAFKHVLAASCGELMACLVRVPTEVIKQRMQSTTGVSAMETMRGVVQDGGPLSMYRGFFATLLREVPFAAIQFPLYERLKLAMRGNRPEDRSSDAALCGSVSGAFAAAVTTPLDVVKTRLMLGADIHGVAYLDIFDVIRRVYATEGWRAFYLGLAPRTMWIGIGGFVFFGAYEQSLSLMRMRRPGAQTSEEL
mmetsp:Transcript_18664/g.63048  ORF Transcript_18664/g.63048 Transcript_18664/m.63048 type:complete len:277 (+) Transcript_18664:32-862(+)|eukprot:CAMPEP_0206816748 /NCGR_PEP_ID=MMETSP0975-20121206/9951_1 /ASSEMBLY_ACC=CAM_ASM_000399 /TAXON_ID=483370 /ORGANISM="non described non described, Strain CCMP2097" /LENGTH=276 /DNA_ID=CAMNT_0054358947 /DNA_START=32 /DNA_END=862 /DNA_ORIENTATION=+